MGEESGKHSGRLIVTHNFALKPVWSEETCYLHKKKKAYVAHSVSWLLQLLFQIPSFLPAKMEDNIFILDYC